MRKRMLRSMLAAALSAVVAFGVLSGLAGGADKVGADSSWNGVSRAASADSPDAVVSGEQDSSWD
ncbi:hypothetical protein IQ62_34470 [Streptomyces scabiei]|nr:hypothetical protein IQ62_34470 [Streptomyces scabiei]